MDGTFQVLNVNDIVEINRQMIARFGGTYFEADQNLANLGSLEHVLEEIHATLFGRELYPTLIAWRIIANHVFHDGNKRTGMEACRLFLELNGYEMRIDRQVIKMALDIATGKVQFSEFVQWVEQRTSKVN